MVPAAPRTRFVCATATMLFALCVVLGAASSPVIAREPTLSGAEPLAPVQQRRVLHVAAGAAAGGDGSARRPLSSLEQARDAVRAARSRGETVEVVIGSGTYELRAPLVLGPEDSGTPDAPVVWRAAEKAAGAVRVVGGRMVTGLKPVADAAVLARLAPEARGKVLTLDLRAQGITDYGDPRGGFGSGGDPGMELFVDDVPMALSRYPNEGFLRITEVLGQTPIDVRGTKGVKEGIFRAKDPRFAWWTEEKDPRVFGYWFWDWADQRHRVASIDAATGTFTLREPWHQYGYRAGQYFYAFNLLSEIDRPGEWYLDREEGRLYVWPTRRADGKPPARVLVSLLPAVMRLDGAKHITLRGLTFEGARGNAVEMDRSEACALIACTLRNSGKWAVQVRGGRACAVRGCDVTGTGEGGIELEGGDRATLTPGGHVVENSHVHHYSRWVRTYQPGIRLSGVGCRAVRNLIHDAPHQAFAIVGNDHLVEGNEVHNVCEESNDAGALYGWNDWAARGNVIQHNWFHHIYGHEGRGANGVYLDDNFSSAIIQGNVFQSVQRAVHLGGGRDHQVRNNLFVDCPRALHIDARGLGWRAYGFEELKRKLEALPYRKPPWSTRYPELLTLLEQEPMAPFGIRVARNVFVGERWDDIEGKAKPYIAMTDNLLGVDAGVLAAGDLAARPPRLKSDAAQKIGFEPLPYDRIGLYASPERARWPVPHPVKARTAAATARLTALPRQ
jgi:Acyl-CoA dehydrogenases